MGIELKKRGYRWSASDQERVRQKLVDAKIIQGLIDCFHGKRELNSNQLAIGLKAWDKLLPNLQAQQIEVTENQPFAVLPSPAPSAEQWHKAFAPAQKAQQTVVKKAQDKPH